MSRFSLSDIPILIIKIPTGMKQSHETNSPSNIPGIENDKDYKMEKESVIDCSYSY